MTATEEREEVVPSSAATNAEIVRSELERIADENGGYLRGDVIVDAARAEESPLHRHFTWDDSEAAERYRQLQAVGLVRRCKMTVFLRADDGPKFARVRQFESSPVDRRPEGGYRDVQDIMTDPERRQAMLRSATAELAAIRKRYAGLTELSEVWSAVDRTVNP